jgi:hypothetical protein
MKRGRQPGGLDANSTPLRYLPLDRTFGWKTSAATAMQIASAKPGMRIVSSIGHPLCCLSNVRKGIWFRAAHIFGRRRKIAALLDEPSGVPNSPPRGRKTSNPVLHEVWIASSLRSSQ